MSKWRNTKEYRNWRKACLARDNHKCAITGYTKRLQVHHLNHSRYFPDQKFDVDNGITVTRLVHIIFHIFLMKGYRKKCTAKDWKRYKRLFKYVRMISKVLN